MQASRSMLHSEPTLGTAIWLLQLRWVAIAGQLLAIGVSTFALHIELRIVPLIGLVTMTAATNLAYDFWLRRLSRQGMKPADRLPSNWVVGGLMILDLVILTGLLYFSGGSSNPFLLFYFVNISVAGLILPPRWAWSITAVTVLSAFSLVFDSVRVPGLSIDSEKIEGFWSIRKQGFLIAFATSCGVVSYFVSALNRELRLRDTQLQEAENQRNRSRRLEALATLAAGAGHELASPLSTIAVVAKELSRNLDKREVSDSIRRDAELIRSELDRCREILSRMRSSAGEAAAEQMDPVSVSRLVEETLAGLRDPSRITVRTDERIQESPATLPVQALSQALRNILQNSLDASPPDSMVLFDLSSTGDHWRIEIRDRGSGMSPEVLQRIGEPFFTTKETGKGMGLGVFLSRNVIQRLGGELEMESELGVGSVCRITLPVHR